MLFRNTRAAIKGFPQRNLNLMPMPLPSQYATSMRVATMMGGRMTDEARAMKMLYPEEIFQEFEGDSATWWQFDPRVNWLLELLKENRNEKVLIIASRASTALQLEQALREREGIRGTVFHEGMSIIERDKAAAYFAQEEGGAQVLICSEIGSEGRNFQFANQLVMFDLPFNPDLLEQRIGRLDRIGQKRDIEIHVPYLQGTSQELLARWFDEGLNAFGETCDGANESSKSAINTFTLALSALITIFLSVGPVISTRRSCKSAGIPWILHSDSRIERVSLKKLGNFPASIFFWRS